LKGGIESAARLIIIYIIHATLYEVKIEQREALHRN